MIEGLDQRSKLEFYIPFNSQGHIGTGIQQCQVREWNKVCGPVFEDIKKWKLYNRKLSDSHPIPDW